MIATDYIFGRKKMTELLAGKIHLKNGLPQTPDAQSFVDKIAELTIEDVSNFQIIGNDIEVDVNKEFELNQFEFDQFGENDLLAFRDLGGKVTELGTTYSKGFSIKSYVLEELYFPKATIFKGHETIGYSMVLYNATFRKFYIPEVTSFLGDCAFFNVQSPELRIYVNPFLETSNNGNWHPVLTSWKNYNARILFVRSYAAPQVAISNNDIENINAAAARLKIDFLDNGNDVDEFIIYQNGVEVQRKRRETPFISGLSKNSTETFEVQVRDSSDQYTPIGSVTITTPDTSMSVRGLRGFYDCQDTSAPLIDRSGWSLTVTTPSGATFQVPGKIGFGVYIQHQALHIQMKNTRAISFWVKVDSTTGNNSYLIDCRTMGVSAYIIKTGAAGFSKMYVNAVSKPISTNSLLVGVWQHVYLELTNPITTEGRVSLGNFNNQSRQNEQNIVGTFDLIATYSEPQTVAEIEGNYNNGNGVTL